MSIWGDLNTNASKQAWRISPRPKPRQEFQPFIPIRSHVQAVRQLFTELHSGAVCAVIHGPSGSGRSMVARQLMRCLGGTVLTMNAPSPVFSEDVVSQMLSERVSQRRSCSYLLIDSVSLAHSGWQSIPEFSRRSGLRTVIVSTTAWWLHHEAFLGPNVVSAGLLLLEAEELEQLANGIRWSRNPRLPKFTSEDVQSIDFQSEGLARVAARLADELALS